MARDLGEQERAFIDALAAETGRDLPAWMLAIAESGHASRNEIIDWLRHQGFTFSNASWLERIHHNGGRLIYAGTDARPIAMDRAAPPRTPRPVAMTPATESTVSVTDTAGPAQDAGETPAADVPPGAPAELTLPPPREPSAVFAPPPPSAAMGQPGPAASSDEEIATLLLAAKGLRPLADFILRHMDQAVPAMVRSASPPFVMLSSPMPFAALLPGPKEVRLFADFGPKARDRTRKADTTRFQPPFPDVIVLNDARQLDDRFRELIETAYTRALK